MKIRDIYWRRYKKHCTQDNDASVFFKIGTLGPHTVLPIAISCPILFSWISSMVWNLFPFKTDVSCGKSQRSQGAISGLYRGWVTWVIWCFAKKLCMRRGAWAGVLSWWSCQSPVAHSCGLLNHQNSFHEGMFKLNTKFDADLFLYSPSHFEWDAHEVHNSLNGVYLSHWLAQWSRRCSHMHIPVTLLGCQVTLMLMSYKPFLLY